jgi:hypothetical protein
MVSFINSVKISQPEFIMKCYDWVEPFAKILEEEAQNEYYAPMLISRGIGNGYPQEKGLECVDLPYGLLNDEENRKKAAEKIRVNFEQDITIEQIQYVNANLIHYFSAEGKNGFVEEFCKEAEIINGKSFGKYIRSYLVPALEEIEKPYEKFAAILIYAQSGCIPLDVYNKSSEAYTTRINALQGEINSLNELKETKKFDIYRSPDFHELDDPNFFGNFYGYFREYRDGKGVEFYKGITPFKLSIKKDNISGVMATFSFYHYNPNLEKKLIELVGKPMLGPKMIQIVFQSETGYDTITMLYTRIDISNSPLQCRYGLLVTQDRSDQYPQVQKFIFFNQPIPKEYEKYVDAYLRIDNKEFIVLEENLKNLQPKTMTFLDKYGERIGGYKFSISNAAGKVEKGNLSNKEIFKEIFEIKKQSFSPLLISTKEEKQLSDFFRSLLPTENESDAELTQ